MSTVKLKNKEQTECIGRKRKILGRIMHNSRIMTIASLEVDEFENTKIFDITNI